jgi:hypothetical protein
MEVGSRLRGKTPRCLLGGGWISPRTYLDAVIICTVLMELSHTGRGGGDHVCSNISSPKVLHTF